MNNTLRREEPLASFDEQASRKKTDGLGSARRVSEPDRPSVFQYKAYFASALTNNTAEQYAQLKDIRRIADEVCSESHIELYVPMDHTHPQIHADIHPTEVYTKDRRSVSEADLLILVATQPSFGAGQELEIARCALIPIIAMVPRGQRLSRMVHGSPTFKMIIEFDGMDDLRRQLDRQVKLLYPWFDEARKARALLNREGFGPRLREARGRLSLSVEAVAGRAGITPEEMRVLEEEQVQYSNPSIILMVKLAQALEVPIGHLLNDDPAAPYIRHAISALGPVDGYVAGARKRSRVPEKDLKIIETRLLEDIRRTYGG